MKKFWIVLLSLGLIMAFSMPVFAVDVKFNGEFKVQGIYEDNQAANDSTPAKSNQGFSATWQRLRVGTVFQVAEGLSLTTRFDALERVWGAPRTAPGAGTTNTLGTSNQGAMHDFDSQNIAFDQAFAMFNAAYGTFRVGYQTQGRFGTAFGDNGERDNGPRVKYEFASGPWSFAAVWDKMDGARNYTGGANAMDIDWEKYQLYGIYKWTTGEGGLLFTYVNNTSKSAYTNDPNAPAGSQNRQQVIQLTPYFKATFGLVYVEAEAAYVFGKQAAYVAPVAGKGDVDRSGYNGYVMAKVDLAPFYIGAAALYVSGDDGQDTSKNKSGPGSGTDFNPCLILLNYDLQRIGGGFAGYYNRTVGLGPYGYNTSDGSGMTNIYAYHIFAGVKPMPKLDVKFSWTYAGFNETSGVATTAQLAKQYGNPVNGQSKDIGHEFDLTATYKIYDNLSYMIGAAYLLPGDYFKLGGLLGATVSAKNDYLLTHMLTLNF